MKLETIISSTTDSRYYVVNTTLKHAFLINGDTFISIPPDYWEIDTECILSEDWVYLPVNFCDENDVYSESVYKKYLLHHKLCGEIKLFEEPPTSLKQIEDYVLVFKDTYLPSGQKHVFIMLKKNNRWCPIYSGKLSKDNVENWKDDRIDSLAKVWNELDDDKFEDVVTTMLNQFPNTNVFAVTLNGFEVLCEIFN